MARTFGSYNFNEDICDQINGSVPADFSASYTDVSLAMFEGTIVLENAKKGVLFNLTYDFSDGVISSVDVKLAALLALRGTIDTLVKDNVTLTGVMLKTVTIQSRIGVITPYTPISVPAESIIAIIGFHKVDA